MEPTRPFPIIACSAWSQSSTAVGRCWVPHPARPSSLGAFRERFFRVGHAHAGVLLVLSLAFFIYLGRTGYPADVQWLAGALLLAGVLAQSGGFFRGDQVPGRRDARRERDAAQPLPCRGPARA